MSTAESPRRLSLLFDPGWLFLAAGLVMIAAAVLVPASYDLWTLRAQQEQLTAVEVQNARRLEAYSKFADALDSGDPQLVRRLAVSQLNRIPKGETPLLLATTANQTPLDWIDASVPAVVPQVTPFPDSLLSRLTLGRRSLWVAGAGALCVFLGILMAPLQVAVPTGELAAARDRVRVRTNQLVTRAMVGRDDRPVAGISDRA